MTLASLEVVYFSSSYFIHQQTEGSDLYELCTNKMLCKEVHTVYPTDQRKKRVYSHDEEKLHNFFYKKAVFQQL